MHQLIFKNHTAKVQTYDINDEPLEPIEVSIGVEYDYIKNDPDCGTHCTNFRIVDAATDEGPIEVTDHLAELAFSDFIDRGDYAWN